MWQKHNIQLANFDMASLRVTWFRWATALPIAFGSPSHRRPNGSGNEIDAAFVFARVDVVNVHQLQAKETRISIASAIERDCVDSPANVRV